MNLHELQAFWHHGIHPKTTEKIYATEAIQLVIEKDKANFQSYLRNATIARKHQASMLSKDTHSPANLDDWQVEFTADYLKRAAQNLDTESVFQKIASNFQTVGMISDSLREYYSNGTLSLQSQSSGSV